MIASIVVVTAATVGGLAVLRRRRGPVAAAAGAGIVASLTLAGAALTAEVLARRGVVIDPARLSHYHEYRPGRLALEPHLRVTWGSRNPALPSVEVRTNADGLRGDNPSGVTPRSVFFAGDSFTFGLGLPEAQTFPRLVADRLSALTGERWTSLNAGVPGYNLHSTSEWIAHLVPRYRPSAIVVTFHDTDDVRSDMNDTPRGLEDRAPLPALADLALYRLIRLGTVTYQYRYGSYAFSDMPGAGAGRLASLRDTVLSIEREGRAVGAPVIFHLLYASTQGGPDTHVTEVFQSLGARLLITPWRLNDPLLTQPGDGHPNEAGARAVAERVLPTLARALRVDAR